MSKKILIKEQKAITLISLVVTIITLIILAGVTISLLISDRGIIARAKEAARQQKISNVKERISLYILDLEMQNKRIEPQEVFDEMKEQGHIDDDAKLEGIWISTFDTKISTISPYTEAIIINGENSGYEYGGTGEDYQYICIYGYVGTIEKDFIIPDYIDGKLVTTISGTLIEDSDVLETVELPDSIKLIEGYTFINNTNLKTIHLPYLLEKIGEGIFYNSKSLTEIIIPENVTTIGKNAFTNCESVSKVVLNDKIQTIGDYAFTYIKNSTTSITIPSTITQIGSSAFESFGINNDNIIIYIPNKEITIGQYAFSNCNIEKYDLSLVQQ